MPKAIENICCKKKDCVTLTQRFYKLCLNPDILQLCILNRADIRNVSVRSHGSRPRTCLNIENNWTSRRLCTFKTLLVTYTCKIVFLKNEILEKASKICGSPIYISINDPHQSFAIKNMYYELCKYISPWGECQTTKGSGSARSRSLLQTKMAAARRVPVLRIPWKNRGTVNSLIFCFLICY